MPYIYSSQLQYQSYRSEHNLYTYTSYTRVNIIGSRVSSYYHTYLHNIIQYTLVCHETILECLNREYLDLPRIVYSWLFACMYNFNIRPSDLFFI